MLRFFLFLLVALPLNAPAFAWTPASQQVIGEQAARLAPPDLYRQLARNRPSYLVGLSEPLRTGAAQEMFKYPNGQGQLDEAIRRSIEYAVAAIKSHRPFNDVAYRMGVVAFYVSAANNPLHAASGDPQQRRWAQDYLRYLESVEPRAELVFYGFRSLERELDVDALIEESLRRSRSFYPLIGREYRRVEFASGVRSFDDRSTAYAIAALGYSHAVSDIAEVLRYIWLEAGGIDSRQRLPRRGRQMVRLDRLTPR